MDLKCWLQDQRLTVREFALGLGVPLKTAQDWVYRGVVPSDTNRARLTDFVLAARAHHWVIASPEGPTIQGVCQRCGLYMKRPADV